MGRYTQAIRMRALTAEVALVRTRWRFGIGGLVVGAALAAFVGWLL